MTVIHLVRHGSHDLLGKVLTGRMPGVGLNAAGVRESEAAGHALAAAGVGAIFCSPVERARQTAEIIARRCGMSAATDEGFQEIDFGAWTGMTFAALESRADWIAFNRARTTAPIPDGEALSVVQARMVDTVRRMTVRHGDAAVALIGHGDPIKLLLLHVLGAPIEATPRLEIAPASISTIEIDGPATRILAVNRQPAAAG